ncbi:MAG: sugar ABC transporter substrate-binding protein [Candidatus Eremiobacteraeota bacterium]|nr:sugar ABC transporter substrate-binding protein [Candidatus Eremiobacteraeota bacterium]
MQKFPLTILCFSLLCLLWGCGKGSGPAKTSMIGAVLKSSMNPYFSDMEKGIRETAEARGIKATILVQDRLDAEENAMLIDRLLDTRIEGILIVPEGKKRCMPLILKANRLKIPVILLDTGIDEKLAKETGAQVLSLITSDNLKGGRHIGEYLAEKINHEGSLLLLEGKSDSFTGNLRRQGFKEALQGSPKIRIITAPPAYFNRTKAFEIARETFHSHPDIKGAFALNDLMALGVSDAAKVVLKQKILIAGFDASEEGLKAVKERQINATVTQSPYEMGALGVENLLKALRGEQVPPRIMTKTELVTGEKFKLPFQ